MGTHAGDGTEGGRLYRADLVTRPAERVAVPSTFAARRWPLPPLLPAAWAWVDRIATRYALHVALAASLEATLVTSDERLRRTAAQFVAVAEPAT